jgi:hypothetical protein
MDHDSSRHDDRAVALALAAHRLVERGEQHRGYRAQVPRGRIGARGSRRTSVRLDRDDPLAVLRLGAAR